ncbi:MAG: protein O-mannosyl-transferase family [Anaerolineae bacterium]
MRSSAASQGSFQPVDLLIFSAALGLYWATLRTGALPADAGEFQLVAAELGIAHPPGYPLYTMLGRVFVLLMPWTPARAVNLFSAVSTALMVTLSGRAARRLGGGLPGTVIAALLAGLAASVWVTAGQASIRPLTGLFVALCIERLAAYRHTRSEGALFGFGLAGGLGLTHHPSVAFSGLFFAVYLLLIDPALLREPRRWPPLVGGVALGFLPWLYLPLRGADAVLAPAGISTWTGFWDHVLARGFAGDAFAFTSPTALWDRLLIWVNILRNQWHALMLPLFGVAGVLTARRDPPTTLMLAGGAVLHSVLTMTYRAPHTVEYLIPAYVRLAILAGVSCGEHRLRPVWAVALAVAALAAGIRHAPGIRQVAADSSTSDYVTAVLDQAPPRGVVLAPWHWATPLWALQHSADLRTDVEVIYVFPEGSEPLAETWARRIAASEQPVVTTGYYPGAFDPFALSPLPVEPFPAWGMDPSGGMDALNEPLGKAVTLLGIDAPESIEAGGWVDVRAAWRVHEPAAGFVHLTLPDGTVLTADDRPLLPGDYVITRHVLGVPLTTPPEASFLAGAYTPEAALLNEEGQPRTFVGRAAVSPTTYQPGEGILLADGIVLADVDLPETLTPGAEVIVDLTFTAHRALFTDRVIKVDIIGADWLASSDHIPAGGAIPTLKWLPGWVIHDRHRITIPPDGQTAGARAELVIYDHFNNQVYPVLEPSLAEQGRAVPLGEWP